MIRPWSRPGPGATKTALFRRVQRSDAPTWAQGVRSPVEGSRHVKTHPKESPIGLGTRLALRIGPLWATGLAHWAHLASRRRAAKGLHGTPSNLRGRDRGSRLREPRAEERVALDGGRGHQGGRVCGRDGRQGELTSFTTGHPKKTGPVLDLVFEHGGRWGMFGCQICGACLKSGCGYVWVPVRNERVILS